MGRPFFFAIAIVVVFFGLTAFILNFVSVIELLWVLRLLLLL